MRPQDLKKGVSGMMVTVSLFLALIFGVIQLNQAVTYQGLSALWACLWGGSGFAIVILTATLFYIRNKQ